MSGRIRRRHAGSHRAGVLLRPLAAAVLAVTGLSALAAAASPAAHATTTGGAFVCTPSLYFQVVDTQLYEEAYSPGGLDYTAIGSESQVTYNALGYDTLNNYLYASSRNVDPPELLQINSAGTVTDVEQFPDLPSDNNGAGFLAATFDDSGDYIATTPSGGSQYLYELNIATNTVNIVDMTLDGEPFSEAMVDITYSYGYLWGVDPGTGEIARIDPTSGDVILVDSPLPTSASFGAAWTFGNGNLVFSDNDSGNVYQLAVTDPTTATPTITQVSVAAGKTASNNDGASCTGSPVDLGISKTGPASVAVGTAVSWTVTVTNESADSDSSGYTVSDPVPAGYTDVTSPTEGCTVSGTTVTCVEGELDAGDDFAITIDATSPATGGVYTNTATVTGNESDPNSTNDMASVTTDVGFANVSLTKSATTTTPDVDAADTFTLTATNSESSTAGSGQVVVTDDLPASLAYVSSTSSNCGAGSCIAVSGQDLTWTISDLAPGASATLQITVDVDSTTPVGNTASFTQAFPDSAGGTSGSSNTVTLDPQWADVTLTKAATSTAPDVGTDDTFTLTASNAAASTAASGQVVVTDDLPAGLSYVSASPSTGTVGHSGQDVTWTIPTLAAGADATLQIVVEVTATTTVTNEATFTQTVPDSSGGTTGSSNQVQLTPVYANVTVSKSVSSATPDYGAGDTYTLTATNAGPDGSGQVVVTDVVPAGLGISSATSATGTVGVSGQTVTWTIPTLGPPGQGNSASLQIAVVVDATAEVANSASFTQQTPNSSGATTGTSNTVDVTPQWANLSLSKSATTTTPQVGADDTFTLTATNSEASTSSSGSVTVTDDLPAGLAYVSSTPSSGSAGDSGQTVTWTIANLAAGASATLQIVVKVDTSSATINTAGWTQTVPSDAGATTGTSNSVTLTPSFAAVTLTKSATSTAPTVGSDDTFTLTATNSATSTAASGQVTVTDVLPAGLGYVSATPSTGSAGDSGQTVTWTIPNLTEGASATLQIVVDVTTSGSASNTATFTQTTPNGSGQTTGSSNTVTLTPAFATVTLSKAASSTTPDVGAEDTFTLTAANSDASTAQSGTVTVTDTLAAGLTYDSSTPSTGTASDTGQTVTWTIPDLAIGASATLQIVVTVTATTTVANTATFTQTTPDASGGTTGSSNTVDLTPQWADVTLTKSASSATPDVGADDTFTLTASSSEASTADSGAVTVSDVLPAGLTYVSSTPSSGTASDSGQTVTWTIADLAPGVTATLQLVVQVTGSDVVENTASFTQAVPNGDGATTGTSNTVTVTPSYADVSVTKTAASGTPAVGADDTFTLTASNAAGSTSDSGQVVVTDVLPAGLAYVSSTPSAGSVDESGQTVTWTIPDLDAGATATLQVVVEVSGTSTVDNTATFTQTVPDSSGATTGSSNTVVVTPQFADVTVTKAAATQTPQVGRHDTFTLVATDSGPADAGQVVVTDVLPGGLDYVSSSPSTGSVTESGQTVTWTIPDLAASGAGSTASLQIVVTVETHLQVTNTATFTQTTPDSSGGTTGTSNPVTLTPSYAVVTLDKTASSSAPSVDSDDTFTLTATNAGPADAGEVVVSDPLAAGLSFVSASASTGSVAETASGSSTVVTWTIPDLGPPGGASAATLQIVVKVTTTAKVANTATFTQSTPTSSGGDSGSSQTVTLTPSYAVLQLTKALEDGSPLVGTRGTYAITVTDAGPDAAQDVTVTDPLPSGLSYVSATTSTGTVSESVVGGVQEIVWKVGSLADGASAGLDVVVEFTSSGTVVNTASATSSSYNPNGSTTRASATASVSPPSTVPGTHTGEPWSGWTYWLFVLLLGAAGVTVLELSTRRRRRTA